MPERFEIYIVYKRRYINTLPFLSFLPYLAPFLRYSQILVENRQLTYPTSFWYRFVAVLVCGSFGLWTFWMYTQIVT